MPSPQHLHAPSAISTRHRAILDALAAQVAVVGADGVVREVNAAWKAFALQNGACGGDAVAFGLRRVARW